MSKNNTFWVRSRLLLMVSGFLGALSCTHQNPDINRVVEPFFDKAFFNAAWHSQPLSPEEFYYRMTVIDAPPNTKAAPIGSGHWLHPEVVRFEITDKYLIGWRSYASNPGTEAEAQSVENGTYRGVPVLVFAIKEHFNIQREYDALTTETSNVVSESKDCAPARCRFFRVDFSRNLVAETKRQDDYPWMWGSEDLEQDTAYVVSMHDPANPRRLRSEQDYLEFTTRQGIKVDIMSYYGAYGEAFQMDSAAPVIDVRHSLRKVHRSGQYVPLSSPNTVAVKNKGGEERETIWERFGFFRQSIGGLPFWDKRRGNVESTRSYNMTRFDVWEKSYEEVLTEKGLERRLIPIELRTPKPIVYYTNVEHPTSLMAASQKVAQAWNTAFKEMVFYAQPGRYKGVDDVPDMWILHENSCNPKNIAVLFEQDSALKRDAESIAKISLQDIERRIAEANDPSVNKTFTDQNSLETQARADLERICSVVEFKTAHSEWPFKYQRAGDLRYNLLNLITQRAQTDWSGFGPMFADPLTGEILQAHANINLWYLDRRAAQAAREIDALTSGLDLNDVVFGPNLSQQLAMKESSIRHRAAQLPDATVVATLNARFYQGNAADLIEVAPNQAHSRLARLATSPSHEARLFRHGDETMSDELLLSPKVPLRREMSFEGALLDKISPARKGELVKPFLEKGKHLHDMRPMDPPEYLDALIIGTALKYKDLPFKERFKKIREEIYLAVALHEAGHNMGLMHNMAGSSDALNYGEQFWRLQSLPADPKVALAKVKAEEQSQLTACIRYADGIRKEMPDYELTTQQCLGQDELMYSSIMDYHAHWNSDFGGLGAYDKAAIKFGYAQLVETFEEDPKPINQDLEQWLFLNDWKKIPEALVSDWTKINRRKHVKFVWDAHTAPTAYPKNAVPYRFCTDSSASYGPYCKAFDFGPDMRSQARWLETSYWQRYFFTHFAHDRLLSSDSDLEAIVSQDLSVMSDYTRIMQWFYFLKAKKPDFSGSDAERDFLAATVMGLNHFSHVLGQPLPGAHATVPNALLQGALNLDADYSPLQASSFLLPLKSLSSCAIENIKPSLEGKGPYRALLVPLGEGRPLFAGLSQDMESRHLRYVGSMYEKLYAGLFLSYPVASFPRSDRTTDPRSYAISWYRLFPDEVGQLFHDVITQNWSAVGALVDAKGQLQHRDLLNVTDLQRPNYDGLDVIQPTSNSLLSYRMMYFAAALLSGSRIPELDPVKMMHVSKKGGRGDSDIFVRTQKEDVAVFTYPGLPDTYQAIRVGKYPIAFTAIENLNRAKEKFLRLDACLKDPALREQDTFCQCVQFSSIRKNNNSVCCQPKDSECKGPYLAKVGEDTCTLEQLAKRAANARSDMEDWVGFVDDMRWFYETYANTF